VARVAVFWLVDVEALRGREELGGDGLGVGVVGLQRALLWFAREVQVVGRELAVVAIAVLEPRGVLLVQ